MIAQAQPPLDFLPPDFDPRVFWLAKSLLPLWMHWKSGVQQLEVRHPERLVTLFRQFQSGQVRFLLAFRHPSPEDAYCLATLLWHQLPRLARQQGQPLSQTPHVHFMYDRGIPLWAGRGIGWLYTKLGGTSIQRGKVDRQGLRSARHLFAHGAFPMAAAPEGANNGHTEIVSPLEPGIAQLGFWCVEDLRQAQWSETVVILPLGIQYRYDQPPWPAIARLLTTLEQEVGITAETPSLPSIAFPAATPRPIRQLYPRLLRLGEQLLALMEAYYADFYKITFEPFSDLSPPSALVYRLNRLMDAALRVAESFFHLPAKGSVIDRCRRIEQAGWDCIYREDLRDRRTLSPVQRGLADRIAEEATLRMWHMRLVENFVAVTGDYVLSRPTVERFAETLLLLRDTIVRIQGLNPFPRPHLGPQVARLSVGVPLSVSERHAAYTQNRRQAVADLTADLQDALQELIPPPGDSGGRGEGG